jgi:hypothetical protein
VVLVGLLEAVQVTLMVLVVILADLVGEAIVDMLALMELQTLAEAEAQVEEILGRDMVEQDRAALV